MGFLKNAMASAKSLNKGMWIAAMVIPGGLTAVGVWLIVKGTYRSFRKVK